MDELTGERGTIFATGTPISNSVVEMYTMQRYLQASELARLGLQHFDSWASVFGETVTALELAPEGSKYRVKTRFGRFHNIPELVTSFKMVADIQTAGMLKLPTPKATYINVSVPASEIQREMVAALGERAEAVRNGDVEPWEDNMLAITNDGRKLALDQRMMNPLLPDNPESKVNACVDNVFRIWDETKEDRLTQLVFCDLSTPKGVSQLPMKQDENGTLVIGMELYEAQHDAFSVYNDMKLKLVQRGIPEDEVMFIHDANTDARKKELFAKVRKGQVRVLLGSTSKMGAGTNVQDRIIASHDLDCPWRPRDLEQRAGRTVRQGNRNPEVFMYRYVTENTFDAYMYQTIENKQKFISQIMTDKPMTRSIEDIDEAALNYAQIKALASGDPNIKEKMELDVDIGKLLMLKSAYLDEKHHLEDMVRKFYPNEIASAQRQIAKMEQDIQGCAEYLKEPPAEEEKAGEGGDKKPARKFAGMVIKGEHYAERGKAGTALLEAINEYGGEPQEIGEYWGFKLILTFDASSKEFRLTLSGNNSYTVEMGMDPKGNLMRIDNQLYGLPQKVENLKARIVSTTQQMEAAKAQAELPFEKEALLKEKQDRLQTLNALLDVDAKDSIIMDDAPENEEAPQQSRGDDYER